MVFWDGINSAFSCTIYTGWLLEIGGYSMRLLAAKAKVAPKVLYEHTKDGVEWGPTQHESHTNGG